MKKSAKPLIGFGLFTFAVLTFVILLYVGLKLECERLTKLKVLTEEKLNAKNNSKINLLAQEQALSSEERIVKIAETELGMVRRTEPPLLLKVDKAKIDRISETIDKRYE